MARRTLRSIPAVEKVLQALGDTLLPRPLVVAEVRRVLSGLRTDSTIPDLAAILDRIQLELRQLAQSRIQPVINGTGILIHTNLGRVPLGNAVATGVIANAVHYTNLEFDLITGSRGERGAYLERCLALLCGAEAATVTNNGAGALVLILRHCTARKPEVVISRGELIQIGGGFRIPDILEASGARLREIGTTNKTTLRDYERAIGPNTALILRVHRSNFFMGGFVESVTREDLAALARRKRLPLVEDLGSGALVPTESLASVEHEPTPREVLRQGITLTCFSGDKLLGGPQAGIIAGKAKWVRALKREPFFRALRCDKLVLAALQTVAEAYLNAGTGSAALPVKTVPRLTALPVLTMLHESLETLWARAEAILAELTTGLPCEIRISQAQAQLGGGTLPRSSFPSVVLDLKPKHLKAPDLNRRLRLGTPPVIGYLAGGRLKIDLRTVLPEQDPFLTHALQAALSK